MPWILQGGKPVKVTRTTSRDTVIQRPVEVPDGSVSVVTEWVGDDPERAKQALRVERQKDNPRVTLVEALERVE